jgi:hypothetical protein
MTKKHFIALAAVIKTSRDTYTDQQIQELASFCAQFGPNFDCSRFIDACGGGQ